MPNNKGVAVSDFIKALAAINKRTGRNRSEWQQELELSLLNFAPDPIEASQILETLTLSFGDPKVARLVRQLKAALEDFSENPEGLAFESADIDEMDLSRWERDK